MIQLLQELEAGDGDEEQQSQTVRRLSMEIIKKIELNISSSSASSRVMGPFEFHSNTNTQQTIQLI